MTIEYDISCGAVIVKNDKFLLVHQNSIYWGFSKGHIEGDETEIETTLREIKEETNLDVDLIEGFREEFYYEVPGKHRKIVLFLAKSDSYDVTVGDDVEGYEWLSYEKALERLTYDNSKEVLKKAKEFLILL